MLTVAEIPGQVIPIIAIGGSMCVAVVGIVSGAIARTVRSAHVERTRREIAAYVAEGSMTPDEAERFLKAGGSPTCGPRGERKQ